MSSLPPFLRVASALSGSCVAAAEMAGLWHRAEAWALVGSQVPVDRIPRRASSKDEVILPDTMAVGRGLGVDCSRR